MGVKDDDDNLVELFAMTGDPLPELREALVKAAGSLEGRACGLNAEFVWGSGWKFLAGRAAQKEGDNGTGRN